MINKKILLGKVPQELGVKDAVHVAIVSVRAACSMVPGSKCGINKDGEAILDSKSVGIADPFLKNVIMRGQNFNLLLNPDIIDNVQHIWEHPKYDFMPPIVPVKLNYDLLELAKKYGVTYEQVIEGMHYVVQHDKSAPYPSDGTKSDGEWEDIYEDKYSIWSSYSDETLYEFDNIGSECCPEYNYPDCAVFKIK